MSNAEAKGGVHLPLAFLAVVHSELGEVVAGGGIGDCGDMGLSEVGLVEVGGDGRPSPVVDGDVGRWGGTGSEGVAGLHQAHCGSTVVIQRDPGSGWHESQLSFCLGFTSEVKLLWSESRLIHRDVVDETGWTVPWEESVINGVEGKSPPSVLHGG